MYINIRCASVPSLIYIFRKIPVLENRDLRISKQNHLKGLSVFAIQFFLAYDHFWFIAKVIHSRLRDLWSFDCQ